MKDSKFHLRPISLYLLIFVGIIVAMLLTTVFSSPEGAIIFIVFLVAVLIPPKHN